MTTSARASEAPKSSIPSPKDQFLSTFQREHATTFRVLRAYPADQAELRPAPKCKTARELAWTLVLEQGLIEKALTTGFDFEKTPPSAMPEPPATLGEVIEALEKGQKRVVDTLEALADDQISGTVSWFVKPKTVGDVPTLSLLWMILHDHIHHRGQFSIYLRMAGGKVPSIYGPTADEQWM